MDQNPIPQQSAPKSYLGILIIILLLLLVGGGLWYFFSFVPSTTQPGTSTQPKTPSATIPSTPTEIKSDVNLETASNDLDNTNIDGIDTTLSQNDTDAAGF